jgi:hypothetical protein
MIYPFIRNQLTKCFLFFTYFSKLTHNFSLLGAGINLKVLKAAKVDSITFHNRP